MAEPSQPCCNQALAFLPPTEEHFAFCRTTLCKASCAEKPYLGTSVAQKALTQSFPTKPKVLLSQLVRPFILTRFTHPSCSAFLLRSPEGSPPIYLQSTISGPFLQNICIQTLAGLKSLILSLVYLFLSLGVEINPAIIFCP